MVSVISERRVISLKILIGVHSGGVGSPKMNAFLSKLQKKGFDLDDSFCSDLLMQNKEFQNSTARGIEKALELPDGWMDSDHAFRMRASDSDIQLLARITNLPEETRNALVTLIKKLSGE